MIAKNENDLPAFVRLQGQFDVVRTNGLPAEGDGIGGIAAFDYRGLVPAAIRAKERLALRVESDYRLRAGKVCKVVAAFAVLGLVIDDSVFDFHLPGIKVALKVRRIVLCIP